jgi:hypothetical protein
LNTYPEDVLEDAEGEADEVEDVETDNVIVVLDRLVSSNVMVDVKSSSIVVVNSLVVVK